MATGTIQPKTIYKDITIASRTYGHLDGYNYNCDSVLPTGYRIVCAYIKTADSIGDALNFIISPTLEGTWLRIFNSNSSADFTMSITIRLFLYKLY